MSASFLGPFGFLALGFRHAASPMVNVGLVAILLIASAISLRVHMKLKPSAALFERVFLVLGAIGFGMVFWWVTFHATFLMLFVNGFTDG